MSIFWIIYALYINSIYSIKSCSNAVLPIILINTNTIFLNIYSNFEIAMIG